jgi:hypothetical protein
MSTATKSAPKMKPLVDDDREWLDSLQHLPPLEKVKMLNACPSAAIGLPPMVIDQATRDVAEAIQKDPSNSRLRRLENALKHPLTASQAAFAVDLASRTGDPLHRLFWDKSELKSYLNPPKYPTIKELALTDRGRQLAHCCLHKWREKFRHETPAFNAIWERQKVLKDGSAGNREANLAEIERTLQEAIEKGVLKITERGLEEVI